MKHLRLITGTLAFLASTTLMAQWSQLSTLTYTLGSVIDTAKNCSVITGHGTNIYAGTTKGLLMSADNGLTWTNLTRGNPTTMAYDTVMSISFINNGSATVMMIGTRTKIFASTDNGVTWTDKSTGLAPQPWIRGIVQKDALLVAISQSTPGGVYLSDTYGAQWDSFNMSLDHKKVNCILLDGSNLYIGSEAGVFLSTNNGQSWTLKNSGLPPSVLAYALTKNDNKLYAGSGSGAAVWVSSNNGDSWDSVRTNLPSFCQVFGMLTAKGTVYISESGSTPGSIYKLDQSNNAWIADTVGLNGNGFFPTMGMNEDGSLVYIVSGNKGLVFVKDLGPTGINDLQPKLAFDIWPNPAHSFVNVQAADFDSHTRVLLINQLGQTISESTGTPRISLDEVPAGVYFIQVGHAALGTGRKILIRN